MPTILLKDKIDGGRAQKFQLAYICDKTHPSHKLVTLCCEVHYMWWVNQYLELQDREYGIKSNKTRILDIIMLVLKNNA